MVAFNYLCFRTIIGGLLLFFSLTNVHFADPITPSAPSVQLLDMVSDPVLIKEFYAKDRITRRVDIAEDGAVGANILWEQKTSNKWFIEEQRDGADLIQAGVAMQNRAWIEKGIKVLDWGFKHECPDGSFGDTKDAAHSVSFFVEAVSRAILVLQQGPMSSYDSTIQRWLPLLDQASLWLIKASAEPASQITDLYPFTHRYYLVGAGLVQAGVATHHQSLIDEGEAYIRNGLKQQWPDGTNPEKGGFDAGYQMVGITLAFHYIAVGTNADLIKEVRASALRGLARELTVVKPDGSVDISSSTRVGKEHDRTGQPKTMNYRGLTNALLCASLLTTNVEYRNLAENVAQQK